MRRPRCWARALGRDRDRGAAAAGLHRRAHRRPERGFARGLHPWLGGGQARHRSPGRGAAGQRRSAPRWRVSPSRRTSTGLPSESWYFPNHVSGVGPGTTSDAEFVANTSLYPPEGAAASLAYADRELTSLPRILGQQGYESYTFHTNSIKYWNRSQLYPALGFSQHFDKSYFGDADKIAFGASDRVLFDKTLDKLAAADRRGTPLLRAGDHDVVALPVHRGADGPSDAAACSPVHRNDRRRLPDRDQLRRCRDRPLSSTASRHAGFWTSACSWSTAITSDCPNRETTPSEWRSSTCSATSTRRLTSS